MEGEAPTGTEELEEESKILYPIRTLRRIYFTVANPLKAMSYVAYDPDYMIIPVMFIVYAIFSFLQPFIIMGKMVIPSDVTLQLPTTTVGAFKTDFERYFWGVSLTSFVLTLVVSIIALLVISKFIIKEIQIKTIISGTVYATVVLVIVGLLWLGLAFLIPDVIIPYGVHQNITYIDWQSGSVELTQPTSLQILGNITLPTVSEAVGKTLTWRFSSLIPQTNGSSFVFSSDGKISVIEGRPVAYFGNGSSISFEEGVEKAILNSTFGYVYEAGKPYLVLPDGARLQVKQGVPIVVTLNFSISSSSFQDQARFSWPNGNLTAIQPTTFDLGCNFSLPSDAQKNQTYMTWIAVSALAQDNLLLTRINATVPSAAQNDEAMAAWRADAILAQSQSLMIYFNKMYSLQTPEQVRIASAVVLPILTRVWQSIIVLILLKKSHETSWIKAGLVVIIQQAILYFLNF